MNLDARLIEARLREPLRNHLSERCRHVAHESDGTPSAVLIALFDFDGETHVWLLRRASGMRSHSGQVAFPGGKRDDVDASLVETALRETEEEIGIARSSLDILGVLDDLVTITGYVVTPVVAWLSESVAPVPNAQEVARVFPVPLRRFVHSAHVDELSIARLGYTVDGEFVWGATAYMARSLGRIVGDLIGEQGARPNP